MGAPSLCEVLIGMRTMRRSELLSSKCSNTQRHGGVGDQYCGQDEDGSGANCTRLPCDGKRGGDGEPKKSTTGIAHENSPRS
jgi:hypothetical protein